MEYLHLARDLLWTWLANAAFERAFAIDPELASAYQFYTLVQVDTGQADQAMKRLLDRLQRHPGEPEPFATLVQVFRLINFILSRPNRRRLGERIPTEPLFFVEVCEKST